VATALEWVGSSGNFILDGTGIADTAPTYVAGAGGFAALVFVDSINTLSLAGASASERLQLRNNTSGSERACGLAVAGQTQIARFQAAYLELNNNNDAGVDIGRAADWVVKHSISHDNGGPGFAAGFLNDWRNINGGYQDCEAYNNGNGPGSAGYGDAFFAVGGESLWFVRCSAHNNYQRGFDTGQTFEQFNMNYQFRDMRSWENGRNWVDQNVYGVGLGFSGDDRPGGALMTNYIVGAVIFRNPEGGAWMGYGNGGVEIWNAVLWGNAYQSAATGDADLRYDRTAEKTLVRNTIIAKRPYTSCIWAGGSANDPVNLDRPPNSDYNIFRPVSAPTEALSNFNYSGGTFSFTQRSFSQGVSFMGPNDIVVGQSGFTMANTDPRFVSTSDTLYQNTNFLLQTGSAAIDRGTFLMLANGAGSGTTIQVRANGGSSDPRNYFIGPTSYYQATADKIQIEGCGQVTITAMTATSMSFTPSCSSWVNGAGIHLPWSGARPDIGAFEFGVSTLSAPTNLRKP
jgi:hypothetical protein